MTKKKYDLEDGVWRTIGGRRVFIRKGQALSDAMKESGKFKKKDEEKDNGKEAYKSKRAFDSYSQKMKSHGEMDKWTGKEYTNDEFMEHLTDSNWHSERKMLEEANLTNEELGYIKDKTSLSKWSVGEELTGKENTQKLIDEAKGKFGTQKEWQKSNKQYFRGDEGKPVSMRTGEPYKETSYKNISERDAKDLLKQLNDEGSDFSFGDAIIKDGKVKTDVGVFMPDERGYVTKDLEIPISENETYSSLEEKLRDWQSRHDSPDNFYDDDFHFAGEELYSDDPNRFGDKLRKINDKMNTTKTGNDYLPKASKISVPGNSNRKEVKENIQAHILDHYDNPVDFMEQMDAFDNMPTRWHAGQEMAKQGFYDIYYDDQREFLESLNINPKGKKFSDDRVFETYSSLIGRESNTLYDKMQKLFEQYKKEHKNSDATLDDFRKWFK